MPMNRPNSTGVVYALLAYGAWGLLPVYWKQLQGISAIEILCHRIIWSLVFLGGAGGVAAAVGGGAIAVGPTQAGGYPPCQRHHP